MNARLAVVGHYDTGTPFLLVETEKGASQKR